MTDDWSLLQEYVQHDSKQALDTLVRRHLAMVYGAALRQLRDPHLAADATQVVFLVLMKRAAKISRNVVLGGWLMNVTLYTVADMRRSDRRRQRHELLAAAGRQESVQASSPADDPLAGALDAAIASMPRKYRDAVVMRYFQQMPISEVAQVQNVTEAAARQRLSRAIARLRDALAQRGVVETEQGIDAFLTVAAARALHEELAVRIVNGLHSPAAAGAASPLVAAVIRSLIMTQLKTAIAAMILLAFLGVGAEIAYWAIPGHAPRPGTSPHSLESAAVAQSVTDNTPNSVVIDVMSAFRVGDVDAILASFEPMSPDAEKSFRQLTRSVAAIGQLRTALTQHFGAGPAEKFIDSMSIEPSADDLAVVQRAKPTIDGDHAQLIALHVGTINLVIINGTWKLKADALHNTFTKIAAAAPMLESLATGINAGKYSTIQKVQADFRKRINDLQSPDPMPSPDRPAVLAPGATPAATLAAYYWALVTDDETAAIACTHNPTPAQQQSIGAYSQMISAGEKIRVAIADKFNTSDARKVIVILRLDSGINQTILDQTPTTFPDDKAQVDIQVPLHTIYLTKIDGVWKIEPLIPDTPSESEIAVSISEYVVPLCEKFAADVKAGNYATPNQLKSAVLSLRDEINSARQQSAASTQP